MDPKSKINALIEQASNFEINPDIPINRYFRSCTEIMKIARVHEEEKALENAFILYMRLFTMHIEKLRTHPDYVSYSPAEKKKYKTKIEKLFPIAEEIKQILMKRYSIEQEEFLENQKFVEADIEAEKKKKDDKINLEEAPAAKKHALPIDMSIFVPERSEEIDQIRYDIGDLGEDIAAELTKKFECSPKTLDASSTSPPIVNRDTKPSSLLSVNESKTGFKIVIIPADIVDAFLRFANSNTSRNIETLGILSGRLARNEFIISHLIVPKQVGTSDSCSLLHEEELYEQQDRLDLITVGWIHTHPKMTAFLSSVDLHTHCPFQLLLPEAIAIVCAPSCNQTGYFNLTPYYGLSFISKCRQEGFHPHPNEPPLFQDAEHIRIEKTRNIKLVDLRS